MREIYFATSLLTLTYQSLCLVVAFYVLPTTLTCFCQADVRFFGQKWAYETQSTHLSKVLHDERVLGNSLECAHTPSSSINCFKNAQVILDAPLHHSVPAVYPTLALWVTLIDGHTWPDFHLQVFIISLWEGCRGPCHSWQRCAPCADRFGSALTPRFAALSAAWPSRGWRKLQRQPVSFSPEAY